MGTQHPTIDDSELGTLTRAESTLDDGQTVTHDWFAGTLASSDQEIELVIDGSSSEQVERLVPRTRAIVAELDSIRRRASDAIITRFSDGEPTPAELDDGFNDLVLDTIEATVETTVLHFTDSCGQHFPEGFWPAVQLDETNSILEVSVES